MKILWITPKWPVPSNDGQRIATVNLLKPCALKHEVSLLSFLENTQSKNQILGDINLKYCKTIQQTKRENITANIWQAFQALFSKNALPITLSRFVHKNTQKEALSWIRNNGPWDIAVVDTLHSSGLFYQNNCFQQQSEIKKIIYRAHNVESSLWQQAAENKNPLLAPIFSCQANAMRSYEKKLLLFATTTVPVSESDKNKLQSLVPDASIQSIEIGMDFQKNTQKNISEEKNFLFVGRLDWPPNRDGLTWFLKKIWPVFFSKNPHSNFSIIGSGNSAWLNCYKKMKGVSLKGSVGDLQSHYEQATALLLPIFYGSGTRVKAIESASYKTACISTKVGVEGLDLKDQHSVLYAELEEDWIRTMESINRQKAVEIGTNAYHKLKVNYDLPIAAENFLKILEN